MDKRAILVLHALISFRKCKSYFLFQCFEQSFFPVKFSYEICSLILMIRLNVKLIKLIVRWSSHSFRPASFDSSMKINILRSWFMLRWPCIQFITLITFCDRIVLLWPCSFWPVLIYAQILNLQVLPWFCIHT